MVKSHAISNATATVMPGDREARKAKPLHDDHHVLRHGALRIWCMVLGRGRATAAPIATQIGADYRKVTGKHRRDAAPHEVCLRKTVQQEDRRPGAGPARKDTGLARLDLSSLEVIHHCKSSEPKGYLAVWLSRGARPARCLPRSAWLQTFRFDHARGGRRHEIVDQRLGRLRLLGRGAHPCEEHKVRRVLQLRGERPYELDTRLAEDDRCIHDRDLGLSLGYELDRFVTRRQLGLGLHLLDNPQAGKDARKNEYRSHRPSPDQRRQPTWRPTLRA